jgi:orotate phosphoribosyltransferase
MHHNRASDQGYIVPGSVEDLSVLLVDDTFTTGARAQSAASALQLSGARLVAMVAVGRVIAPDFSAETKALWDGVSAGRYDFDVCCLEP